MSWCGFIGCDGCPSTQERIAELEAELQRRVEVSSRVNGRHSEEVAGLRAQLKKAALWSKARRTGGDGTGLEVLDAILNEAEAMRLELDAHVAQALDSAPPIDPVAFAEELDRDALRIVARDICIAILDGVDPDPEWDMTGALPEDLNDSNDFEAKP
jgi:hypothetical protein